MAWVHGCHFCAGQMWASLLCPSVSSYTIVASHPACRQTVAVLLKSLFSQGSKGRHWAWALRFLGQAGALAAAEHTAPHSRCGTAARRLAPVAAGMLAGLQPVQDWLLAARPRKEAIPQHPGFSNLMDAEDRRCWETLRVEGRKRRAAMQATGSPGGATTRLVHLPSSTQVAQTASVAEFGSQARQRLADKLAQRQQQQ